MKQTRCLEGIRDLGWATEIIETATAQTPYELMLNNYTGTLFRTGIIANRWLEELRPRLHLPLTVGGGIRELIDAEALIRAGADRIFVNSALFSDSDLFENLVGHLGESCVILNVETRKVDGNYEVFSKGGREHHGIQLQEWISRFATYSRFEVMVTSIATEGTGKGFPTDLVDICASLVEEGRLLFCGGISTWDHVRALHTLVPKSGAVSASLFRSQGVSN